MKRLPIGVCLSCIALLCSILYAQTQTPFVEPDDGRAPLTKAFDGAKQSIDLYIFELTLRSGDEIIQSIRGAVARGVRVRALLEPCPGEGAACVPPGATALSACRLLTQSGVAVKWANPAFPKTHAKSILLDNARALVVTLNLVPQTFSVRRDYGVVTDDPGVVEDLSRAFIQDWQNDDLITNCSQPPNRRPNPAAQHYSTLIISPDINPETGISRAREQLIGTEEMPGLVLAAQETLKVQMENLDWQVRRGILSALLNRIDADVQVQVLLKQNDANNAAAANRIRDAGGEALCQKNLHAKLMIVDGQQVYVGSQNLTEASLHQRREIGWVTADEATRTRFEKTFDSDWAVAESCVR